MKGALGMHRIIGIFLISLLTVSWPGGRIRWVTGDVFFSLWTGRRGAGHLLCYGGDLLPPWEVVRGQHGGSRATLCIPSNPAALASCAELVFACARQERRARHGRAWHPWLVVWGHGGGRARGAGLLGICTPFQPGFGFLLQSPVKMGEPSFDPSCAGTWPGWLGSCKPQFCEPNLQVGVPVAGGSSPS